MSTIMLFFIACSARPFASGLFDGPTVEEDEEIIVSTESGVETEEQENINGSEPSEEGRPSEEDTNVQSEDQEYSWLQKPLASLHVLFPLIIS